MHKAVDGAPQGPARPFDGAGFLLGFLLCQLALCRLQLPPRAFHTELGRGGCSCLLFCRNWTLGHFVPKCSRLVLSCQPRLREKVILAQGELISTGMMDLYLQEQGIESVLLPALNFMRITADGEPDPVYIREKLVALLDQHPDTSVFITQGFICRNAYGDIDNLQRGGSDYSASLIGAAVDAEEIQIWTDIDGMHNNDPRVVNHTSPVRQLNFEEAAKLAHFGAKILHPCCIRRPRKAIFRFVC